MAKYKLLFCTECGKVTKFSYFGRERIGECFGPLLRIPMALFSVGVTEMSASEYYECVNCGKVKEV